MSIVSELPAAKSEPWLLDTCQSLREVQCLSTSVTTVLGYLSKSVSAWIKIWNVNSTSVQKSRTVETALSDHELEKIVCNTLQPS